MEVKKKGQEPTISEIQRFFLIVGSNISPEPERSYEIIKETVLHKSFCPTCFCGVLTCAAVLLRQTTQLPFHLLNFLKTEEKYQTYSEFIMSLEAIFLSYIIQS